VSRTRERNDRRRAPPATWTAQVRRRRGQHTAQEPDQEEQELEQEQDDECIEGGRQEAGPAAQDSVRQEVDAFRTLRNLTLGHQ
jgi:hypothetical protein